MQKHPFQRIAEVLSVIAAELLLFSHFPLPLALVCLLSASCFPSPPLSPSVFPTLTEIQARHGSLTPHPPCARLAPHTGIALEGAKGT